MTYRADGFDRMSFFSEVFHMFFSYSSLNTWEYTFLEWDSEHNYDDQIADNAEDHDQGVKTYQQCSCDWHLWNVIEEIAPF